MPKNWSTRSTTEERSEDLLRVAVPVQRPLRETPSFDSTTLAAVVVVAVVVAVVAAAAEDDDGNDDNVVVAAAAVTTKVVDVAARAIAIAMTTLLCVPVVVTAAMSTKEAMLRGPATAKALVEPNCHCSTRVAEDASYAAAVAAFVVDDVAAFF